MQTLASTKGFYGIVSAATGIGIFVVMVLFQKSKKETIPPEFRL
jgi:hypothetical protein